MTRCTQGQMAILARNSLNYECFQRDMGIPIICHELVLTEAGVGWLARGNFFCQHCGGLRVYLDADLDPVNGLPTRVETGQPRAFDAPKPEQVEHAR